MKINKIELKNIGSYEGLNQFDIADQNGQGNVVVIGGKNGAGKTTMFTSIKLCLYGHRESGYQAINAYYKKSIKRLVNDKAKIENKAEAYVLLDLSILNGQEWDNYVLKRSWELESTDFEKFEVKKNGVDLSTDEVADFENYLLNLIPPELFELYFFDGEQIADFFLNDSNNERIKAAFLTICGYDTFDIIYKNFKRISKSNETSDNALEQYFTAEDELYQAEKKLKQNISEISRVSEEIELEESKLAALEKDYRGSGGVSIEEWNSKFLELKNEERIREEKNNWLKAAVNEIIPYIILKNELKVLLDKMNQEKENERLEILKESMVALLPKVLANLQVKRKDFSEDLKNEVLQELLKGLNVNDSVEMGVLNLSKMEYQHLLTVISKLLEYDKNQIIEARVAIKESVKRGQQIREQLDQVNVDGIDVYLAEKEEILEKCKVLLKEKEELTDSQTELTDAVEKAKISYKRAEKELDKQLKNASISTLTARSILFLEELQRRLFKSEIEKVQILFMEKMRQLMRKDQFIDKIVIDDDFRVHVYKRVTLDCDGVCEKINQLSVEKYMQEFGEVHCADILQVSGCKDLYEFVLRYKGRGKAFDVMLEFDKAIMSKGEKQVFIMALYWAMIQLSNKEIPFIIDTPFARIDTEHRAHITEYFFKKLKGQVFIFSTDEEITQEHMNVIGNDLAAKFLIENTDNTKTEIKVNKYFGE